MRLPLEARASLIPQKSAISCRIAAEAKQAPDTANNRRITGFEQAPNRRGIRTLQGAKPILRVVLCVLVCLDAA